MNVFHALSTNAKTRQVAPLAARKRPLCTRNSTQFDFRWRHHLHHSTCRDRETVRVCVCVYLCVCVCVCLQRACVCVCCKLLINVEWIFYTKCANVQTCNLLTLNWAYTLYNSGSTQRDLHYWTYFRNYKG